jgi:microcystin-dependent protein
MIEPAANLLNSTYFGGNSTQVGAIGGAQSRSLATANLPPYTPSGSITNGAITISHNAQAVSTGMLQGTGQYLSNIYQAAVITASQQASVFDGTSQGGTSTPVSIVQPTICCNYIIRII